MRYPEPRAARRAKKRARNAEILQRRKAEKEARRAEQATRHPLGDPRETDDRRQQERRSEALTGEALDRRLRELGITDRRQGPRRTGVDRRRG